MFKDIIVFDWNEGNKDKNVVKHNVSNSECEEIFFNKPIIVSNDAGHSENESRYYALGRTNENKNLFIAYTIRENKIRIISARPQSKKERLNYEKAKKNTRI